jgi:hypothetical protein
MTFSILLSISGFFRLLILLVSFYLVIKVMRLLFAPGKNNSPGREAKPNLNEDEMTLRFNRKGEKIIDKEKGEFVDFEEVD